MKFFFLIGLLVLIFISGFVYFKEKEPNSNPVLDIFQEETLDLSSKGLTSVPKSVFEKTSLTKLDLSNNNLDGSLQAEVRHLKNLRILDLSDNNFTGVPAEIGQLSNLEELDLSNNKITGLPYELGNLSKLRFLDLTGNDYSKVDLEIIRKSLPSIVLIKTQ